MPPDVLCVFVSVGEEMVQSHKVEQMQRRLTTLRDVMEQLQRDLSAYKPHKRGI